MSDASHAEDPAYPVRFCEMRCYYANLVDYLRLALCAVASFTLVTDYHSWTAGLILTSFLLDWIDGPLARAYGQTSLLGDGLDWFADLYVQVLLMLWWGRLEPRALPFVTLATMIEVGAALFDFAITAADRYPKRGRQSGFAIILQWAIPYGRYNRFGTFLWVAYPFAISARCLYLGYGSPSGALGSILIAIQAVLALPAILYVWSDAALLASSLERWREARRPGQPCSVKDPET